MDELRIDVWSDIGCPWCYLGSHRLDQAVNASPHAGSITVALHAFELDPSTPTTPEPILQMLAKKMRLSPADAAHMESRVVAMAHAEGLDYTSERMHANSFDAHRVLALASASGQGVALMRVLQAELFSGRANVYEPAVILELAEQVGLDRDQVEQVLSTNAYADDVRRDESDAHRLGATGVPFTVLDQRFAIPGAVSVDGYAQAIAEAWGDT